MKIFQSNIRQFLEIIPLAILSLMVNSIITAQPFSIDQPVSDSLIDISYGDALWGDYDGDGDLDIVVAGISNIGAVAKIYKNEGLAYFPLNAGLMDLESVSVAWCDFDNDNDLDVFTIGTLITEEDSLPKANLYENAGDNQFNLVETGILGVFSGEAEWDDMDNDGDQDLIMVGDKENEAVTRIYRNEGSGGFTQIVHDLPGVHYGDVDLGDFDNDMDLDILIIGMISNDDKVLKLYRNDGEFSFSGVFSEFVGMSESCIQWGDYDYDGDLDILASGSTEAPTHLVYIYQNQGQESFMNIGIEIFGTVYGSLAWGDYDNDGDFDFLLTGKTSYSNDPVTEVYRNININLFNMDDSLDIVGMYNSSAKWGDYDNDGDLDIIMAGSDSNNNPITQIYSNKNTLTNNPPSVPENLQTTATGSSALFNWSASVDIETPTAGLTYNLRVGTTPGGSEIVSPMANPVGDLFIPQQGNVGSNLSWILYGLSAGTYYWSIQAVDNNFQGSGFFEEETFDIISTHISDQSKKHQTDQIIHCYPNPFSDKTKIKIQPQGNGQASINVRDNRGTIVRKIVTQRPITYSMEFEWNGTDEKGSRLPQGQYFISFERGEMIESSKVILLD